MPDKSKGKTYNVKSVALLGLLFALAMVLSFFENMLPAMPGGIKLGLSNIVTMYCLFFLGKKEAFTLALLKSLFVLLLRGPIGATMSLMGGIFSVLVMTLLMMLKQLNLSYLLISVAGAVFHNIGQLVSAYFILRLPEVLYYAPIMVVSGIVMGVVTGVTLKSVIPYMDKLNYKRL